MFSHIETLAALAESGTMTRASTRLRLTQSAVSKRIAVLEAEVGRKLIEKAGRGVQLTPAGVRLLEKAAPHLAALRQALREESLPLESRIVLGISESILASWGPKTLAAVRRAVPGLKLQINAHRSPAAIARVRSGEYMLALGAGISDEAPDLRAERLCEETMVVVPAGLKPLRLKKDEPLGVITIEPGSATWTYLARRLKRLNKTWPNPIEVRQTLQSFACIVQMARSGFGHGLVPLGLTRAMGVSTTRLLHLPAPGLTRPISLVGRSTTLALPAVQTFYQALHQNLSQLAGLTPT